MIEWIAAAFAVFLTSAVCSARYCMTHVVVRQYRVRLPGYQGKTRAVMVSDLHNNNSYGKDNQRLLETIRAQRPDLIFAPGDIMGRNAREPEIRCMLTFLQKCNEIAPTIYSPGNHEYGLVRSGVRDLYQRIEELGIPVLNNTWIPYELGGQTVALGGTIYHAYPYAQTEEEFQQSGVCRMLAEMENSGMPTVVLAHKPDTFGFGNASERWKIGLILSGHVHGGIIRLPLLGGLFSPGEILFPGYDRGWYRIGSMQMIIGGGLAGYARIPRIFNPGEVSVVEIGPENGRNQ